MGLIFGYLPGQTVLVEDEDTALNAKTIYSMDSISIFHKKNI